MGNSLRRFCCDGFQSDHVDPSLPISARIDQSAAPLGPHGVTVETVGFAALARDLFQFETTGQVPEGLSQHVQSSKTAQKKWYKSLLTAWKAAQHPPRNAQEASGLVLQTLQGHRNRDVEGLLSFYGLPPSLATAVAVPAPEALYIPIAIAPGPWPKGVQYELHTLPVESKGAVDGDTLVVYVDASNDAREAAQVPVPIQAAVANRTRARLERDFITADALRKEILNAGYKVLDSKDGTSDLIARKYRVRLRGVDAPENSMAFGHEAKAMLQSLVDGQPLRLLVYNVDRYGRIVADVYCNKGFIQEILLKNGGCWHYADYDKRQEFAKWEEEARVKKLGLWEEHNPKKPWEYRKDGRKNGMILP